jgi:hypothetical protein
LGSEFIVVPWGCGGRGARCGAPRGEAVRDTSAHREGGPTPNEVIRLELYEPDVKSAFVRAQESADAQKHVRVTPQHVIVAMLEAGWGLTPFRRAGLVVEEILAAACQVVEQLPTTATEPAFLDQPLLAAMARAERLRMELGRPLVDLECTYRAFGESGFCSAAILDVVWSAADRWVIRQLRPGPPCAP